MAIRKSTRRAEPRRNDPDALFQGRLGQANVGRDHFAGRLARDQPGRAAKAELNVIRARGLDVVK